MTARFAASIALALVLTATASCGSSPRPADVVVFASGSDLESANPLVTIHPLSRQVQRYVLFVTLVRYDSLLGVQPYLAHRWAWSGGGRDLTLALESPSRIRWQDGRPTTARDVAFTLLTARDRRVGYARAADLAVVDTVTTPNDSTVIVRFSRPQRGVPAVFAELPIVPAHLLAAVPAADMRRAAFNLDPVGNGPFRFAGRTPGQRWRFTRNDSFPLSMGGPPRVRELVIAVVDEPTTKFAGLASGDLDFAGIAPTMAALAGRDPMIDVVDYPVLFSTALVFNSRRPPFDDVRVRRAVDLSVDRARIVQAALAGYGTPAGGAVPPENPVAVVAAPRRDPRLADSLLDAAGFRRGTDGRRPVRVDLLTVASGDNAIEQLVQADLAERGIRVEIRQLELAAFLARARAREKTFDLLITGVPGDLSLSYLSAMFASDQRGGSLDYADFHAPALDAAFARARAASSDSALHRAWADVQRELARDVPVSWLYHARGVQGVSARMNNVVMDLRGELVTVARWTTDGGTPAAPAARAATPGGN